MHRKRLASCVLIALGSVGLSSTAAAIPMAAISNGTTLVGFDSATPGTITGMRTITGLQAGETIVGLDLRPVGNQLMAVGSSSRVYTISTDTGGASAVAGPFTPALSGTAFGVDFNPTVDRIRFISDTGQNGRLNPDTGATAGTDTPLSGGGGSAVAAAYTNNFVGAATTTLYVIDSANDSLYIQGGLNGTPSPNTGVLTLVGPLGVDTSAVAGFDIIGAGTAFAALSTQTGSGLYSINLSTGAATLIGTIAAPGIGSITGITAPILAAANSNVPTLSSGALFGLALGVLALGMFVRRRAAA